MAMRERQAADRRPLKFFGVACAKIDAQASCNNDPVTTAIKVSLNIFAEAVDINRQHLSEDLSM